ncbi:hypothetical protein M9H77_26402 [Catharanthus roseus]|uniref:Uncharacterized protein n=1 Tax=Catharanthus roseus TaxID=4058 RepID=A0ACC0A9W6_CATRO|nr:hypothetical protein M9H77_26402 [Catharanthus roseus]
MGNKKLIAENIADTDASLYEEFKKFLADKQKQESETSSSGSYSQVISEEDNIASYHTNTHKEIIFLLDNKDLQWRNDPWILMNRYLDTASYAVTSYKQRPYYEHILKVSSCDITHFYPNTKVANIYNFSKIIIKRIISVEEWRLSPLKEKEFIIPESKLSFNIIIVIISMPFI